MTKTINFRPRGLCIEGKISVYDKGTTKGLTYLPYKIVFHSYEAECCLLAVVLAIMMIMTLAMVTIVMMMMMMKKKMKKKNKS